MDVLLLASALLTGALLAVQASTNLQLTEAVGTPYGASTLQLWVAVLLLISAAVGAGSLGALGGVFDAPPWLLLGGLASPLYITSGILLSRAWARWPRAGSSSPGRCWRRSPSTCWVCSVPSGNPSRSASWPARSLCSRGSR